MQVAHGVFAFILLILSHSNASGYVIDPRDYSNNDISNTIYAWNLFFDAIFKGYGLEKHFSQPENFPFNGESFKCYLAYKLENVNALIQAGLDIRRCVNVSIWDLQIQLRRHSWRRLKQHMTHELMQCKTNYGENQKRISCWSEVILENFKNLNIQGAMFQEDSESCVQTALENLSETLQKVNEALENCLSEILQPSTTSSPWQNSTWTPEQNNTAIPPMMNTTGNPWSNTTWQPSLNTTLNFLPNTTSPSPVANTTLDAWPTITTWNPQLNTTWNPWPNMTWNPWHNTTTTPPVVNTTWNTLPNTAWLPWPNRTWNPWIDMSTTENSWPNTTWHSVLNSTTTTPIVNTTWSPWSNTTWNPRANSTTMLPKVNTTWHYWSTTTWQQWPNSTLNPWPNTTLIPWANNTENAQGSNQNTTLGPHQNANITSSILNTTTAVVQSTNKDPIINTTITTTIATEASAISNPHLSWWHKVWNKIVSIF